MTTPADNRPYGIINDAMQDAGWLQDGNTANPEQLVKYMRRLRDLINTWQTKGLKLWVNVDTSVTLVANQAVYVFSPTGDVVMVKPLRVMEAYYLYTSTSVRRPLDALSWNTYLTLGQVGANNAGAITSYFVNKKATQLDVTFWPEPDTTEAANGTAHVLLQQQITAPVALTETMEFPEEWRMALRWGLADDICTGQPQAIMDRCAQKAELYRTILEDWDVEDASTFLQPDARAGYSNNSFR